jgi:hypothetical protein
MNDGAEDQRRQVYLKRKVRLDRSASALLTATSPEIIRQTRTHGDLHQLYQCVTFRARANFGFSTAFIINHSYT